MDSNRSKQTERGIATVERVASELKKLNMDVEFMPATKFTPDLVARLSSSPAFACEVKGMRITWQRRQKDIGKRTSRLKLPSIQWEELVTYSKAEEQKEKEQMIPIVIVELKTTSRRVPYLYFVLDVDALTKLKGLYRGNWISATVWEIIAYGLQLKIFLNKY